ncbi:profilin family protein [Streptomyces sp. cmx-4-9]|uniref:profilin family protein n=1 Tax=Streptomyces sp. cmx-4-9 TaxID=2790941 RepID=UPI00397EA2D8
MLVLQQALDSGAVARVEVLHEDGSVWRSVGRPLTSEQEGRRLAALLRAPSDAVSAGITVGGVTYLAAEAGGRLLHGRHGGTGVVAVHRPPCIVVGSYGEGRPAAAAVRTVASLADLFTTLGDPQAM